MPTAVLPLSQLGVWLLFWRAIEAQHYSPLVRVPYTLRRKRWNQVLQNKGNDIQHPSVNVRGDEQIGKNVDFCAQLGDEKLARLFRENPSYHREVAPLALVFGHTLPLTLINTTTSDWSLQQPTAGATSDENKKAVATDANGTTPAGNNHLAGTRIVGDAASTEERPAVQNESERTPQTTMPTSPEEKLDKQIASVQLALRYAYESLRFEDGFALFGVACGVVEIFFPCSTDSRMLAGARSASAAKTAKFVRLVDELAEVCEHAMRTRFVHHADAECRDAYPLGGEVPDESSRFGPRAGLFVRPQLKQLFVRYRQNVTKSLRAFAVQQDHGLWDERGQSLSAGEERSSSPSIFATMFMQVVGRFFPNDPATASSSPILIGGQVLWPTTQLDDADDLAWWRAMTKLHAYSCSVYYALLMQSAFLRDNLLSSPARNTLHAIRNHTIVQPGVAAAQITEELVEPVVGIATKQKHGSHSIGERWWDPADGGSTLRRTMGPPRSGSADEHLLAAEARESTKMAGAGSRSVAVVPRLDEWDVVTGHAPKHSRRGTAQEQVSQCTYGLVRWWHVTQWADRKGTGEEDFRALLAHSGDIVTTRRVAGHPDIQEILSLVFRSVPIVPLLFRLQSGLCASWQAEKTSASLAERKEEIAKELVLSVATSERLVTEAELVGTQERRLGARSSPLAHAANVKKDALQEHPGQEGKSQSESQRRPKVRLLMVVWRSPNVLRYLRNIQLWQCYANVQGYEFVVQAGPPDFLQTPETEKFLFYSNLTAWVDPEIWSSSSADMNHTQRFAVMRQRLFSQDKKRRTTADGASDSGGGIREAHTVSRLPAVPEGPGGAETPIQRRRRPVSYMFPDETSAPQGANRKKTPPDDVAASATRFSQSHKRWESRDRGGEELAKQPWFRLRWWRMRQHLLQMKADAARRPDEEEQILITVDVDTLPNPSCFADVALHRLVDRHPIAIKDTPPFSEVNTGGLMVTRNSVWSRLYLEELCETLQQSYFTPAQHPDMLMSTEAILHVLRVEVLAKLDQLLSLLQKEQEGEATPSAGVERRTTTTLVLDRTQDHANSSGTSKQDPATLMTWKAASSRVLLSLEEVDALKANSGNIIRRLDLSHCWRSYNTALRSQVNAAKCWNEQVDGLLRILKLLPHFSVVTAVRMKSFQDTLQERKKVVRSLKALIYGPRFHTVGSIKYELEEDYQRELRLGLTHLSPRTRATVMGHSFPKSVSAASTTSTFISTTTTTAPLVDDSASSFAPSSPALLGATEGGNLGERLSPYSPEETRDRAVLSWEPEKRRAFLAESTYRFQHWLYESVEVGIASFRQKSLSEVVHFVDPRKLEMNFRPTQFLYAPHDVLDNLKNSGVSHPGRIAEVHEGFTPMVAHWAGLRWDEKQISMYWYLRRFNGTLDLQAAHDAGSKGRNVNDKQGNKPVVHYPWYDYNNASWSDRKSFENLVRTANASMDNLADLLYREYHGPEVCAWAQNLDATCQPSTAYHRLLMCRGAGEWLCG
ncbi:unnamed protein product [Amoebophrya sp. A120]|nr:unnamed protein product [Amoebophrya sp. A120]|eukprot:GSA120T00017493001.1